VMLFFVFAREPAIDNMPRQAVGRMSFLEKLWEAVTAFSHHPDYPAEIAVETHENKMAGRG
jgi:hypothetical protein